MCAIKDDHDKSLSRSSDPAFLFETYVWSWFTETFKRPSPPQAASWPEIAQWKNTLIFSPTGSGKTLAAFLWCINELFRMGSRHELRDSIYVLYISPLKALNNDVQKNLVYPLNGIREYAQKAGIDVPEIRSEVRTGDTPAEKRAEMSRRPPHILITTPESIFIMLSTQKFREAFRTVKFVIVDEIHALSDNKRGVHLSLSLERLRYLVGKEFIRIGLSATQRPLVEIARFLVGMNGPDRLRECEIVDIGARKNLNVSVISPVDNLVEARFDAIWGSAYEKLISMINGHDTTLIFTNSRYKTERTALRLNELSGDTPVTVGAHHGSMSKNVRLDMENLLKNGKLDALVATSSLELGIDVGSIDLVCQIESPKSVSKGMQRIGRAGHLLNATSEGRLLVTDRDDLVESAVLVKAIMDGDIDTTRVPTNCLDVLAQQIVGAVAADEWRADDLFNLFRRSYCYRDLRRDHFDRTLDMLAGNYDFDMEKPPYPKILWDKVNNVLSPERGARMIAFRSGGTIPDIANYDVYLEEKKTKVGQLDEGFVEELHTGDIFILGSSSWQVLNIQRDRVLVKDVYGKAPTIPYWHGERDSRTYDLGVLVARFRREMGKHMANDDPTSWLKEEYYVDDNGARAIHEYFREQRLATGELPNDKLIIVEHFDDELGNHQVVIHSSYGIRVNDAWAMALSQAIGSKYGFRPQDATVDDGILITVPKDREIEPENILDLVNPDNLSELLEVAILNSPLFASRFRHNAVRSLLVLRESRGMRTPVWLQNLRASAILEACHDHGNFPLVIETLRECSNEALDVPNLRKVLNGLRSGEIGVKSLRMKIPSPFTHSLLLLGQFGEMGSIPTRERRSRLMHLHREVLRQILDEGTLRNLLDEGAVKSVESQLQCTQPQRKARNANELARVLLELGDLVCDPDDDISVLDRVADDAREMISKLVSGHRAILVPIPSAETNRERLVSTENYPLYRAAFGTEVRLDDADRKIIRTLMKGPLPPAGISAYDDIRERIDRLVDAYLLLRLPNKEGTVEYVAAEAWIPPHIYGQEISRQEARRSLVQKFLRWHGPMTKYEIMERYGFSDQLVERALTNLHGLGGIVRGEYVPTKSFPQWCHKGNLEEIHRLTLNRLRKELEPATPFEYADFLIRLQHMHPEMRLSGIDGLRSVIGQLQGQEEYQAVFERDIFPTRLRDYDPSILDRLCYGGEVLWRRFDYKSLKRGHIGFCLRKDADWIAIDPNEVTMKLSVWDDDIPSECDAVRRFLAEKGACFFDDIVEGTKLDRRLVLRAVWHLIWTGEATNDSYESIRHANIVSGLSGCYDLGSRPQKKGVTLDIITRHMLKNHRLDPTLGRWAPTERLSPSSLRAADHDRRMMAWANLLLGRYGIVSREALNEEVGAPQWKELRRAFVKLELLGKVRRGFFVQELSGEQYAYPEAVETLREVKKRRLDAPVNGPYAYGPMMLLNTCDLGNPFSILFPITNEVGEEIKFTRTPGNYIVLQGGQPIALYGGAVEILVDLSKERAENALRTLMTIVDSPPRVGGSREINVRDWNGNPIDVSPARHLLLKLGFVDSGLRWKGYIYDGSKPDDRTVIESEKHIPDIFERWGKEKAPVRYDAEWIVSRSPEDIRNKVRELIELFTRILPSECEIVYGPRNFEVLYRGVRCINPWVQQKKIWLQITHRGWTRGILIDADTDTKSPKFSSSVLDQFTRTRQQIDSLLDDRGSPPQRPERKNLETRFVIQEHQARSLHWDFRIEIDGALKSWAIPKEPPLDPGDKRLAVQVADHSLKYIDFQHQIPEDQNNTGSVKIWDRGIYELSSRAENRLILKLNGDRMRGEYVLLRTGYKGKMRNWLFYRTNGRLGEER